MRFKHTDRPEFLFGFTDFFTAGLFYFYMPLSGLQNELDETLHCCSTTKIRSK